MIFEKEMKFSMLLIRLDINCIPNKIQNKSSTDLKRNKPGNPPASADFSKTFHDLSTIGMLLMKIIYKTGKAKIRQPSTSIIAWYLELAVLYIKSILTCPLCNNVYPEPNKNTIA